MMKIMKLEIKSAINVLIQINREDQDMSLVEMELWYLYAMEESYARVHKCRLQRVNNGNQKDVVAASNNKDTDQPTKVNEQLEQQSKLYKSDEEFQENNSQVTDDEELQGSDEHVNTDEKSQRNDGHLDIHEQDQTAPLTPQSTFKLKKDQIIIQFYLDEDGNLI